MADVKPSILAEAKNTLNIGDTSFDTDLNTDIDYAIKDLFPLVVVDVTPSTISSINVDNRSFAIPAGIDLVRRVEIDGANYDFTCHAGIVYLSEEIDPTSEIVLFGYTRVTKDNCPSEAESILLYWTVSKFYNALAGNRRKYNTYIGTQGSAADRDIKDSADYFKQLGDNMLEERFGVRGS